MSPDDVHPSDPALPPPPPAGRAPDGRTEIWVGADTTADNLMVLRPDDGGYALVDPHNGWRQIRRFTAYEAAYCWLTEQAYERADGR